MIEKEKILVRLETSSHSSVYGEVIFAKVIKSLEEDFKPGTILIINSKDIKNQNLSMGYINKDNILATLD